MTFQFQRSDWRITCFSNLFPSQHWQSGLQHPQWLNPQARVAQVHPAHHRVVLQAALVPRALAALVPQAIPAQAANPVRPAHRAVVPAPTMAHRQAEVAAQRPARAPHRVQALPTRKQVQRTIRVQTRTRILPQARLELQVLARPRAVPQERTRKTARFYDLS